MPNLKVLSVEGKHELAPDFFDGIDTSKCGLKKISCRDIHMLSSSWTTTIGAYTFPSVSHFEGKKIGGYMSESLLEFIFCFPSLRNLSLNDCFPMSSISWCDIRDRLPGLEEMSITKASFLSSTGIVSHESSLKHLALTKCPILSRVKAPVSLVTCALNSTAIVDRAVEELLQDCVALVMLDISHCNALSHLNMISSTLSLLNIQCGNTLVSVCMNFPLLQRIDIRGCSSLQQLVLQSDCLESLDLTMLSSLKSIEIRCPNLVALYLCGCENLKYFGRYLSDDYRPISIDILLTSCPSIRLGNGSCLGGSPVYQDYMKHQNK